MRSEPRFFFCVFAPTLRIIGPSELEGFDPAERRGLDPQNLHL